MPSLRRIVSGGGLAVPDGHGEGEAAFASRESGPYARQRKYWFGAFDGTWWFYFTGDSTDEVWEAYLAHCRAMLESDAEHPALICMAHRADSPTGDQRRLIGDFINAEATRLSSLAGFVLVLDSPLHILALKAINWFAKKPFPETVCGSPESAVAWLNEHGAHIELDALKASLESQVPPEHRWVD